MLLKKISVLNLGGLTEFKRDLSDRLNVVRERYTDELYCVIAAVLRNRSAPCIPPVWLRRESRIDATVSANGKNFYVNLAPSDAHRALKLSAFDEMGREVTAEYLYLSSHCMEHDLCDNFDGNEKYSFLRVLNYLDETEIFERTMGGLMRIKAFRSYTFDYIKNFRSETIRDGKQYKIVLEENGEYGVRCTDEDEQPVCLSESEQTLFRYLCFLKTAEFWQGFEAIRNLHGVKKPLVIKGLFDRLDESIDINGLLRRTEELGRQVIILT